MRIINGASSRLRKSGLNGSMIAGGAIGGPGAALMTANAQIIYSGPKNYSTSSLIGDGPFTPDVEPINLDGVGGDEFSLVSFFNKGSDFHDLQDEPGRFGSFAPIVSTIPIENSAVRRLEAGAIIDAGGVFTGGSPILVHFIDNVPNSQWTGGTDGYFGYRFNPTGAQNLFGWAQVTFSPDAKVMTLLDWAYESTGAPIPAGAVPEPATSFLMAASLTVAALWRRRANSSRHEGVARSR